MTLGRLVLAWAPTAAWFLIATPAIALLVGSLPGGRGMEIPPPLLAWRLVEATLVTLLAALWFDSLGAGAWWLPFLLVGALATIPTWLATRPPPDRGEWGGRGAVLLVGACADVARYVLAGAILAWRLG